MINYEDYEEKISFSIKNIILEMSSFKKCLMTTPYPKHYHGSRTLEIHYVISGSANVIIKNQHFKVKEKSLYIVNEFTRHGQIPTSKDGLLKYQIYLTYDDSNATPEERKILSNPYWVIDDNDNCQELFQLISLEFKNKRSAYKEVIQSYLKILMIKLFRNLKIDNRLKQVEENISLQYIIDEALLNESTTITLDNLAKKANTSTRELERFIKHHYNKTFNQMKTEARMFKASGMLVYSDKSITEISYEVGYSSPEHFCYAFKKFYKYTPLNYRKIRKEIKEKRENGQA